MKTNIDNFVERINKRYGCAAIYITTPDGEREIIGIDPSQSISPKEIVISTGWSEHEITFNVFTKDGYHTFKGYVDTDPHHDLNRYEEEEEPFADDDIETEISKDEFANAVRGLIKEEDQAWEYSTMTEVEKLELLFGQNPDGSYKYNIKK